MLPIGLVRLWLPVPTLGIESRRESAPIPGEFFKVKTLYVWWARPPPPRLPGRPHMTRPRLLIESRLPVTTLGIESRRESAPIPDHFPKLKTLHAWLARRLATAGYNCDNRRATGIGALPP